MLEKIEKDGHNVPDCQRKMSTKWLNTGSANWACLVEALKSPLVNKEEIAEKLAKAHPSKYMYGITVLHIWLGGTCISVFT